MSLSLKRKSLLLLQCFASAKKYVSLSDVFYGEALCLGVARLDGELSCFFAILEIMHIKRIYGRSWTLSQISVAVKGLLLRVLSVLGSQRHQNRKCVLRTSFMTAARNLAVWLFIVLQISYLRAGVACGAPSKRVRAPAAVPCHHSNFQIASYINSRLRASNNSDRPR